MWVEFEEYRTVKEYSANYPEPSPCWLPKTNQPSQRSDETRKSKTCEWLRGSTSKSKRRLDRKFCALDGFYFAGIVRNSGKHRPLRLESDGCSGFMAPWSIRSNGNWLGKTAICAKVSYRLKSVFVSQTLTSQVSCHSLPTPMWASTYAF